MNEGSFGIKNRRVIIIHVTTYLMAVIQQQITQPLCKRCFKITFTLNLCNIIIIHSFNNHLMAVIQLQITGPLGKRCSKITFTLKFT